MGPGHSEAGRGWDRPTIIRRSKGHTLCCDELFQATRRVLRIFNPHPCTHPELRCVSNSASLSAALKLSILYFHQAQNQFPNSLPHFSHCHGVLGVRAPNIYTLAPRTHIPSPHHHGPKEGLPSREVHHIGVTDVDVHPLAPPELHQAAEPHACVPERPVPLPPGRVQHGSHGLSALEQQLRSARPVGAPRPVQ